ncbi:MAG: PepSY domain-containing protein [Acidobacteria bacterium]|nr:PepSY domain-containing protein [Acidobacteriota bacterium]
MNRSGIAFRKYLILFHRWLGVVFSLLFAMWFVSGLVMMYWTYPGVSAEQRLVKNQVIAGERVSVGLDEAARLAGVDKLDRVSLTMLDARPVYRFHTGRLQRVVYADRAEVFSGLSVEAARRVASAWTGMPEGEAHFDGPRMEEDQWTLNKAVRPLRPFLRFSWADGQEVYVSQVTGEVMQHTTRADRIGAYFGAIPHWLYFTPLRKETATWRALVIVLSQVGTIMTLLGIVVGIWLYSPSKRFRFPSGPSSIPYAGWKRWHTILGLVFGLMTFTWILSGMFSMNPMQWSPEFGPESRVARAIQGSDWSGRLFAAEEPAAVLARAGGLGIKELELAVAGGRGVYLLHSGAKKLLRVEPGGDISTSVSLEWAKARMAEAMPGVPLVEARVVRAYENYYVSRDGSLPLPAYYFEFADAERSMHYVDAASGRLVESFVTKSRWNRWLYHGLHSWDLPWLYANRPSWDLAVILPMLGGVALCVSSVWIAWVRVKRKAAQMAAPRVSARTSEPYSSLSR